MSKNKFKLTLFDFIVIVLVAAVIAYLSYTFFLAPSTNNNSSDLNMKCVIELKGVSEHLANRIAVDDKVVVLENSNAKITSVEVTEAQDFIFDSLNGVYRYTPIPEKFDVIVEVDTIATDNGNYFALNDTKIRTGTTIEVEGPGYIAKGTVLTIIPETSESEVE